MKALKGYVALAGACAVSLLTVFGPETPVGQVLTAVVAFASAVAVYAVPNADSGQPNRSARL